MNRRLILSLCMALGFYHCKKPAPAPPTPTPTPTIPVNIPDVRTLTTIDVPAVPTVVADVVIPSVDARALLTVVDSGTPTTPSVDLANAGCPELQACCAALAAQPQLQGLGSVCGQLGFLTRLGPQAAPMCRAAFTQVRAQVAPMVGSALPVACGGVTPSPVALNTDAGLPTVIPSPDVTTVATVTDVPVVPSPNSAQDSGAVTAVIDAGPEPTFTQDCLGLCQRTAYCQRREGITPGGEEANCEQSCNSGGTYANMPSTAFACVSQACGASFQQCTGRAVAAMLQAAIGATATTAPPGYPTGFPFLPGGELQRAPRAGPVQLTVIAYYNTTNTDLANRLRAELARSGWTIARESTGDGERIRMTLTKDNAQVSVSIWGDSPRTILQVMQFGT